MIDKILLLIEVACGPQYRSKAMKSEKINFKWEIHIRWKFILMVRGSPVEE